MTISTRCYTALLLLLTVAFALVLTRPAPSVPRPDDPCSVLAWFPNDDPLLQGVTYDFTAVCTNSNLYVAGHYSLQGTGEIAVPFRSNPPGSSATFRVYVPPGCQGVVVAVRCYADPRDATWVCQDFYSLPVQQ